MMDENTLKKIDLLHPKLRAEAHEIYKEICSRLSGKVICRFAHTLRTLAEQDALYAQGRTTAGGIVTYAKGGQSYHNYGLAIDIVFLIDKDGNGTYETASWDFKLDVDNDGTIDFEEVDQVFKMYGWVGLYKADGKRWDFPHFQKPSKYSVIDLKGLYDAIKEAEKKEK
jgi:peptidoglycan L-alanyl-D-glutamate endopeptidase CwlK